MLAKTLGRLSMARCQNEKILICGHNVGRSSSNCKLNEFLILWIARICELGSNRWQDVGDISKPAKRNFYFFFRELRIPRDNLWFGQDCAILREDWPAQQKQHCSPITGIHNLACGRANVEQASQEDVRIQYDTEAHRHRLSLTRRPSMMTCPRRLNQTIEFRLIHVATGSHQFG